MNPLFFKKILYLQVSKTIMHVTMMYTIIMQNKNLYIILYTKIIKFGDLKLCIVNYNEICKFVILV